MIAPALTAAIADQRVQGAWVACQDCLRSGALDANGCTPIVVGRDGDGVLLPDGTKRWTGLQCVVCHAYWTLEALPNA